MSESSVSGARVCPRVFKNKPFTKFARQESITDRDLCDAVDRAERGLIDADLGGGLIKQRIPRPNEGRSGGFRSLVVYRTTDRAVFVYGFPKNKRENIRPDELKALKELAESYLALSQEELDQAVESEKLTEVECNAQGIQE